MSYVILVIEEDHDLGCDVIGPFDKPEEARQWIKGYPREIDWDILPLLDPKEIDG
jgi:hypothetical protein